ncbi:spherulation-specific family 4 protein [Streptomyces sp. NPDC059896]|uniref:spherulation-specific family 4 protein n=1 Tax=Streptomyces sp. NPDC059896 TaxID=3346993 RepID=UPI00364C379E
MTSRSTRSLIGGVFAAGALALCAVPAIAVPDAPAGATTQAISQKVSVPAYFYPGALWDQLTRSGTGVGLAVANPYNGPGDGDDQYTDAIKKADAAGITVIGYVATGYFGTTGMTTRSGSTDPDEWMRQIKADVDAWYRLYGGPGLGGIFFDEGLARCGSGNADVNRYIELKNYVESRHGTGAVVVDNPGTGVEECYTQAADTLVTFEGDENSYRGHQPQAWENRASPDKVWHLVYDVPDENRMRGVMDLARQRNAGHVYVTPDTMADKNPWDTLPPDAYWNSEISLAGGGTARR